MLEVIVNVGVIIAVDGLDAATEEGEDGVVLFFGHVVGDGLGAAVEHADAVAELDPELDEVAFELLRQAEGFLFEFDALV